MRFMLIGLLLGLGLVSCDTEEEVPEVGRLSFHPPSSFKLVFYQISNSAGEDIFSQDGYFTDSLNINFKRPESMNINDPVDGYELGDEELVFVRQNNRNLIGLPSSRAHLEYYFDYGNGDTDTLKIINGHLFDTFDAYSWDSVPSGKVKFIFNGQEVEEIELIRGTSEYEDLKERIRFFSPDQDWASISDLFIVDLIKD